MAQTPGIWQRQISGGKSFGFNTMRVKQNTFEPVIWSMIAFSFLFLPVRFWTRWKTFRKFFADDAFALLAWLSAVGMGVMASHAKDAMYYIMRLTLDPEAMASIADPISLLPTIRRFSTSTVISMMLLYTSLWCVKLSFLIFFYRLGPKLISNIKWHWWSVFCFTITSYGITFATAPYKCAFGGIEVITSSYCASEQNLSFINLKVNTVLDVFTDFLIITIAMNILWRSKIPLRQLLALGGLFSLVLITITFSIVRAAVTTVNVTKQMDSPWVLVWSSAEANIAIVVACIGSFRMLFIQHRRDLGHGQEVGIRRVDTKSITVDPERSNWRAVEEITEVVTPWPELVMIERTRLSSTMMSSEQSWRR